MTDLPRRDLLKRLGTTSAVLATGGVGTAAARQGRRQGASAEPTIFEIVEASDDFDTLESALESTDLDAVLDGTDGQYTVFGPTDAAFGGIDLSGLTVDQLRNVLLYHATRGRRYAASVVRTPRVRMLNGGTVTVDGVDLNGTQAEIVTTNVEAANGVVHVIDGVLLP